MNKTSKPIKPKTLLIYGAIFTTTMCLPAIFSPQGILMLVGLAAILLWPIIFLLIIIDRVADPLLNLIIFKIAGKINPADIDLPGSIRIASITFIGQLLFTIGFIIFVFVTSRSSEGWSGATILLFGLPATILFPAIIPLLFILYIFGGSGTPAIITGLISVSGIICVYFINSLLYGLIAYKNQMSIQDVIISELKGFKEGSNGKKI